MCLKIFSRSRSKYSGETYGSTGKGPVPSSGCSVVHFLPFVDVCSFSLSFFVSCQAARAKGDWKKLEEVWGGKSYDTLGMLALPHAVVCRLKVALHGVGLQFFSVSTKPGKSGSKLLRIEFSNFSVRIDYSLFSPYRASNKESQITDHFIVVDQ